MKKPKAPKKTAQEVALEMRQASMLDKEIEEQENRLKAGARGQLGTRSLLGPGKAKPSAVSASRSAGTASYGAKIASLIGR